MRILRKPQLSSLGNPSHHQINSDIRISLISANVHDVCDANPSTKDRIDSVLSR